MSSCVCLHVRKGLCTTTLHLFRAILKQSCVLCVCVCVRAFARVKLKGSLY